jgi:hypothetical protein
MILQVNHINGDATNNDLPNLEVVPAPIDWAAQPKRMAEKEAFERAVSELLPLPTLCRHCAQPIEQTGDGEWIHASGFYSCFDAGYWKQATPKEATE